MKVSKIFIYTDASFSLAGAFGVYGFVIFNSVATHEKGLAMEPGIRTHFFKEANNIRAEIFGAIHGLKIFIEESRKDKLNLNGIEINLYSDCQTLTNLLGRRDKLTSTNYISASKKTTLANADLYKIFYSIYDELKPKLHWVKGHSKKENQSIIQKNFQMVDRQVRKELRTLVKKNQPTSVL